MFSEFYDSYGTLYVFDAQSNLVIHRLEGIIMDSWYIEDDRLFAKAGLNGLYGVDLTTGQEGTVIEGDVDHANSYRVVKDKIYINDWKYGGILYIDSDHKELNELDISVDERVELLYANEDYLLYSEGYNDPIMQYDFRSGEIKNLGYLSPHFIREDKYYIIDRQDVSSKCFLSRHITSGEEVMLIENISSHKDHTSKLVGGLLYYVDGETLYPYSYNTFTGEKVLLMEKKVAKLTVVFRSLKCIEFIFEDGTTLEL